MKLMELTGIKHLKDKSVQDLLDYIRDEFKMGNSKLKRIGKGSNGVAYTDGKQVIKFWHRDSAYEKFVDYCRQYSSNPFLPKFLSPVKSLPFNITTKSEYDEDGETEVKGIRYVKMELLSPFDDDSLIQLLDPDVEGGGWFDIMEIMYMVDKFDNLNEIKENLVRMYMDENDIDDDDDFMENVYHLASEGEEFIHTLLDIKKKVITDYSDMMDSGYNNLAMRGDQIVILDPVANDDDLSLNIANFSNVV